MNIHLCDKEIRRNRTGGKGEKNLIYNSWKFKYSKVDLNPQVSIKKNIIDQRKLDIIYSVSTQ